MRRLKRMGRKFVSVALALTMTLGLIATGNFATITQVKAASALGSNDFLKVNGTQIRKSKGMAMLYICVEPTQVDGLFRKTG